MLTWESPSLGAEADGKEDVLEAGWFDILASWRRVSCWFGESIEL